MKKVKKAFDKWQFGDFQTPIELAEAALRIAAAGSADAPERVVEPSCGVGAFLLAAARVHPAAKISGYEINSAYSKVALSAVKQLSNENQTTVETVDFFQADWDALLGPKKERLLITGNPPWVTSSELGLLNSKNLPPKTNYTNARGIEAITGSSNFDISEYMLLRYLDWLVDRPGQIAVLCKSSVARKVFKQACTVWTEGVSASVYPIDAKLHFGASVDACLFILSKSVGTFECSVYRNIESKYATQKIGLRKGVLVKNIDDFDDVEHLFGRDSNYTWRSGLKHDCSKVMELNNSGRESVNGMGELVSIETKLKFPLLKSSDVANGRISNARSVIVTQQFVGESTESIKTEAPLTWRYLTDHSRYLDGRTSVVYRGKPRFSMFGVGDYTFKPWKVAISGMYKKLSFLVVPPISGKPVVFDDTVYFIPCLSEIEATYLRGLLMSQDAQLLFNSLIFWDEKRPITSKILRAVDLESLARSDDSHSTYLHFVAQHKLLKEQQSAEIEQVALV